MRNVSLKVLVKSLKFLFKKGYEPCACRSMSEKFQCWKSSGRRSLNSIIACFALLSNVISYREKQKV